MRKMALFLLTVIWGCLVYGLHQSIGYERAAGYPEKTSSLIWSFYAALPLFIGAFVTDKNDESQKFNYWFCVIWLSIQAAFLMIFSWLLPIGLIPLLGLSLILWPHAAQSVEKTPINLRALWRLPALALLIASSLFYLWHYNPLPTDEEMIQNFHDHRSELEQLAHEEKKGSGLEI